MENLRIKDFKNVANKLNIETAALQAVCEVEAPGGGFYSNGTPKILFERHKFHKFTGGVYSNDFPEISNKKPGGYSVNEHKRLQRAVELNREAALKSASWGKFQLMGFNYKLCGFTSLQDFINAMYKSEEEHLKAFVNFIKNVGLIDELQRLDWKGFARGYNGKNYHINNYDVRMERAYKRLKKQC